MAIRSSSSSNVTIYLAVIMIAEKISDNTVSRSGYAQMKAAETKNDRGIRF